MQLKRSVSNVDLAEFENAYVHFEAADWREAQQRKSEWRDTAASVNSSSNSHGCKFYKNMSMEHTAKFISMVWEKRGHRCCSHFTVLKGHTDCVKHF